MASRQPIGYYEAPLASSTGERTMSVWLPLLGDGTRQYMGRYVMKIAMGKKLQILASMVVPCGVPSWLVGCLPTVDFELPTATSTLASATPGMVASASNVRGLVVIAHGLSDGPLTFAHVAEELAANGFIVATPACADSTAIDDPYSVVQYGKRHLLEHTVVRADVMEACAAALRATFAAQLEGKQTALIGYSIGTDTVRNIYRLDGPRVYVAGPGWQHKIAAGVRPTPALPVPPGPSLQLLCSPDGQMDMFQFTLDEAAEFSGHPDATRVAQHEWVDQDWAAERFRHVRIDFAPFAHGNFKFVPFGDAEDRGWSALTCGCLGQFAPDAAVDGEVVQHDAKRQRARMCAEVITKWLLARM